MNAKIRHFLGVATWNLILLASLLVAISLLMRFCTREPRQTIDSQFDANTIRSTYPNYAHLPAEEALRIFADYAASKNEYRAFIGWKRKEYRGSTVNIEGKYGTRLSTNHQADGSIWFLGGSTLWGTGAPDHNTIPSFFASLTGESVWNLGESGFNSFQELVLLQSLLVNGLKPKAVVFYDGVNESLLCNASIKRIPTHGREEDFRNRLETYHKLKKEIRGLRATLQQEKIGIGCLKGVFDFLFEPFRVYFEKAPDERPIESEPKAALLATRPLADFKRENYYSICGENTKMAVAAAKVTVETWRIAYNILESIGVPVWFVLQPSAQIGSHSVDYLIHREKQRIIDTKASFEARYRQTTTYFSEICGSAFPCDRFVDLSEAFDDVSDPIFIDQCHVSPNGNRIIADQLVTAIQDSILLKNKL